MLQRRQREILSSSDGRERQMEFYLFFDYLSDIMKDPFLDICSFVEESQLDVLEKRALVTKDTFTTARVYKNWLPKNKGNEIFILEKDIQKIKGIWLSENNAPLYILMDTSKTVIHREFLRMEA